MVQRARKILARWNRKWMREWGREQSSLYFGHESSAGKRKTYCWKSSRTIPVTFLLCLCLVVVFLRVLLASFAHSFSNLPESISEKKDELRTGTVNCSRSDYDVLPSCDRIVAFSDEKGKGFGAQVNRMLEAAVLARFVGAAFILPTTKDWNYGCGNFKTWSCYFEELHGECLGKDSKVHQVRSIGFIF
uniref:O-fucosyltransferase family protein n=1 Tax=Rhodosorus marinus TaxID=101924 RepID=A0A7S0G0F2_9RHOD